MVRADWVGLRVLGGTVNRSTEPVPQYLPREGDQAHKTTEAQAVQPSCSAPMLERGVVQDYGAVRPGGLLLR